MFSRYTSLCISMSLAAFIATSDMVIAKDTDHICPHNVNLDKPLLGSMDTLNSLPNKYPHAISLAPGKPADEFCKSDIAVEAINIFKQYNEKKSGIPVNRLMAQYGKIHGIINELIAKHLKADEDLDVSPEDILVTVGFQEAATIITLTLFDKGDVLITPDPGYTGMTGIATLCGVEAEALDWEKGLDIEKLETLILNIKEQGKTPKAMYVASSYCNPQGISLSLQERKDLLKLAEKYDFYIIEDATYNLFNYDEAQHTSLRALDTNNRVIYVGSFAKSIYPALRVGFILFNKEKGGLFNGFVKVKSFTTINTPTLDQAVVGGLLLKNNYSLKDFIKKKKKFFKTNRDLMIETLQSSLTGIKGVKWTKPKGGFFLTVTLPFNFTQEMLKKCAEEFEVIVLPMYLLSLDQKPSNQVRLSFTTVKADKIKTALERFSQFVKKQIAENNLKNK